MSSDVPSADRALADFLEAASDDAARTALGELLDRFASPLVWKILRRQLGGRAAGFDAAELEDLHSATLLKLQLHLASIRAGERAPPTSFPDYVAVSSFNAAAGFLMAREPERTRLRDRVRYVLRRDARLAVWSGADRELLCGTTTTRGSSAPRAPRETEGRLRELVGRGATETGTGWGQFPRLIADLLDRLAAPCRFEELVDALAERMGIVEGAMLALGTPSDGDGPGAPAVEPIDATPSAERQLDLRTQLVTLWAEIRTLPDTQRFALLANLRGEGGEDLLDVLLSSRAVSRSELAAALGMSETEWRELSPTLPRDDLWIAARLGLARQQVINLRKSARLRLARRLRGVLPGVG